MQQEHGKGHCHQQKRHQPENTPFQSFKHKFNGPHTKFTLEDHFLSNKDQISDQIKGRMPREPLEQASTGSILSKNKVIALAGD